MPEALDGYYEDIVTYAIPLERQPEDTSLKPKVTFGNLKSAVIKDESKAVNREMCIRDRLCPMSRLIRRLLFD